MGKIGLQILAAAAVIGLLANILLRATPWGSNVFLFVAAFVAATVYLARKHRPELLNGRTLALFGAMVFFASMYVLRDAPGLKAFDTAAIIVLMGVLILSNFGINQRIAGVAHYAGGFLWAGFVSLFAPILVLGADIDWTSIPGNRLSRSIFSVLRGLAVALPLVLIFGGLFMAADAAFENFANRIVNFRIDEVISHIVLTSVFAWLTAGYFRGFLVKPFKPAAAKTEHISILPKETAGAEPQNAEGFVDKFVAEADATEGPLPNNASVLEHINKGDEPNTTPEAEQPKNDNKRDWQNWDNSVLPQVFTIGKVETVIVLGLMNALFLSFVIFQLPYLFGGIELVQNTPDFKLSDYARRGFGELVVVVALVLPILLGSHWLLRKEAGSETIFRVLAGIQIVLLFVIMASAMQRLLLLTGEFGYGMTEARFYPMVFMFWLAAVLVWFGWTVLRGKRNNFAWGALWAAIAILGITNLVNPDAFIARTNVRLMQQGRDFDAFYNSGLSDDAVPVLLKALPSMSLDDRCEVGSALHYRYRELGKQTDIRTMNYGGQSAYWLLLANDSLLHQTEGCPPRFQNDKPAGK